MLIFVGLRWYCVNKKIKSDDRGVRKLQKLISSAAVFPIALRKTTECAKSL